MSIWKILISLAVVAVVAVTGTVAGVAWAQDDASPQGAPTPTEPEAGAETNALGGGTSESSLVPIVPCRVIDTRKAGGALAVGAIRPFVIRGNSGSFVLQGGKAGGCGIPDSATAVEVTITAVDAGSGFLRAWPVQTSAPNATFMNYTSAFNVSNTGTLALCDAGSFCFGEDLNLRAFGSATQVVADVNGYYTTAMGASVSAGGSVFHGSRVVSSGKASGADGQYEVQFDRDITECVYSATINTDGGTGWASAGLRNGSSDKVFVITYNSTDQIADRRFYVEVTC